MLFILTLIPNTVGEDGSLAAEPYVPGTGSLRFWRLCASVLCPLSELVIFEDSPVSHFFNRPTPLC